MKKTRKKLIVIVSVVILLAGAVFGSILLHGHMANVRYQRAIEAEIQAHRESVMPYIRLHYAFGWSENPEEILTEYQRNRTFERMGRYLPLRESEMNRWGIDPFVYEILKFYEVGTGIVLSYELVIDYFSEELEPDGSLRLYNNGNHPEIEAFVTWMWEGRRRLEVWEFRDSLTRIYSRYIRANHGGNFERLVFYELSPQMLDALARAYADPDYVLDLTSIQQAGY